MLSNFGLFTVIPVFVSLPCKTACCGGHAAASIAQYPHREKGKGSWLNIAWSEGGRDTGSGLTAYSCPSANVSLALSPSFILPPNSTSQCSALLAMAHRTPRCWDFPFGNSGNAPFFSPLLFLGLDLQWARWDVCAACPLCLERALFQCRDCTRRTCQTRAGAVAWFGHCCRHRATANTEPPLRMVGLGLLCLRPLWTQCQGLFLVLHLCWWQVQLSHTTALSAAQAAKRELTVRGNHPLRNAAFTSRAMGDWSRNALQPNCSFFSGSST